MTAGQLRGEHPSRVLAGQLQDRHAGRVLANELRIESRWDRPCRAFNLRVHPPAPVAAALGEAQDAIAGAEPGLLRVPRHALHSMAAWLIPVELAASDQEKESHWQRYGPGWRAAIAAEAAALDAFRLRFTEVVATDAAIIALAWPAEPINRLRRALAGVAGMPPRISSGDFVHITLFRYREPLSGPAGLVRLIAGLDLAAEFGVREFLLVRETVFPSVRFDVLDRFQLG
jgi:hypothetical protein